MAAYDAGALRDRLDAHRAAIDEGAKAGYLVEQTERVHKALCAALSRWDGLDETQQATLADAVLYVVDVDDAESDTDSPVGLQDDVDVVRRALRTVAPDIAV